MGCLATSGLAAVQADLPDTDAALSTASYDFMRAYGAIWGVSIPAAIFNSHSKSEAWKVSDSGIRSILAKGAAYEFFTFADQDTSHLSEVAKEQVQEVFARSMRVAWLVGLAFCLLGFLLVFVEKNLLLRETLDTEFGLDEKKDRASQKNAEREQVV